MAFLCLTLFESLLVKAPPMDWQDDTVGKGACWQARRHKFDPGAHMVEKEN